MKSPRTILPEELAALPQLAIIDLREHDERDSELGFIPCSRHFPLSTLTSSEWAPLHATYEAASTPLVLSCLGGQRSLQAAALLSPHWGAPVYSLEGGLLAWSAEGFPCCGVTPPEEIPHADSFARAQRHLIACFSAETIEHSLDDPDLPTVDPVETVVLAIDQEIGQGIPPRQAMLRALDQLAEIARRRGHDMARIAQNVDQMRAMILAVQSPAKAT